MTTVTRRSTRRITVTRPEVMNNARIGPTFGIERAKV
jgi:hypothetical protein